jgi:hypothetical protein
LYTEEPKFDSSNSTSSQNFKGNNRSHNEKTEGYTKSAIRGGLLKQLFKAISSLPALCEGRNGLCHGKCFVSLREQKCSGDLSEFSEDIVDIFGNLKKSFFVSLSHSLQQQKDLLTKLPVFFRPYASGVYQHFLK